MSIDGKSFKPNPDILWVNNVVDISYVMLVSRFNKLFLNSIRSVARQNPESFKVYVDEYMLGEDVDDVCRIVENYGGESILQKQSLNPDGSYIYEDHHIDMVHTHHRAFLEAEHPVIAQIDDDDEMLSSRRDIVDKYFDDGVGIIYGDVLMLKDGGPPIIRKSKQIGGRNEVNRIKGSGRIINRDAFEEIHDYLDHGYWLDFKIYYWLMRAGYRAVYVPKLLSVQNYNIDINTERQLARETGWQHELERLERTEF